MPGWWVLTDTENLVVLQFKEHDYNNSQKVTVLDESELLKDSEAAFKLARIMGEMGDYMARNHYHLAMP